MDINTLREQFLAEQPAEVIDKLTPPFYALIDETIESVIDGSTNMNGKTASTVEEALTLIRYGVIARAKVFHQTILSAKNIEGDNIIINYRGTILKVK